MTAIKRGTPVRYTGSKEHYLNVRFTVSDLIPERLSSFNPNRSIDGYRYTLEMSAPHRHDSLYNVRRQSFRQIGPTSDNKRVGIDFDDTLARKIWPEKGIGAPIEHNFKKLRELVAEGWEPVIHTARHWDDYDLIKDFMSVMGFPSIRVICGKPLFKKYIGDEAENEREASWIP
jgi:hypothetical protein